MKQRSSRLGHSSIRRRLVRAASVASVLGMASMASAQVLYWDLNGSTLGIGGAGSWDTTSANWNTEGLGTLTTQTWSAGNTAQFSAGTTTTSAFTVTVPAGVQIPGVNGVNFEEGVVTLSGGDASSGLTLNNNAVFTHGVPGVTSSTSRTHTINVPLLSGNGVTFANAGTNSTGTFILTGANTFSGVVNINGGTLVSAANTTAGGVIMRLTNPNQLGSATDVNIGPSGSTFGGGTTVFTTGNAQSRIEINAAGSQTYTQGFTITGGGLRAGPGGLQINGGNVTISGPVTVQGTVNNEASNLPGIGVITGSTLTFTGDFRNATGSGSATVGTTFAKTGEGTLILAGASSNTYAGFARVFNGVLVLGKDGALGPAGTHGFIEGQTIQNALSGVNSTIAFAPGVDYTTQEVITLGGANAATGFNNLGAIAGLAGGTSRFAGDLRVGGQFDALANSITNSIGVESGGTLELAGKIYASTGGGTYDPLVGPAEPSFRRIVKLGGGTLIISGANDGTNGAIDGGAGSGTLAGFNNLIAFAEQATGGTLDIRGGAVVLKSASPTGGALTGSALTPINFNVNPGAALVLDNSLAVNTNRVNATATIGLLGGELALVGNAGSPVTQAFGAGSGSVSIASYSTLTVSSPGAQTILSMGATGRTNFGTGLVRGVNGGTSQLQFDPGGELSTNVGGGGGAGSPLLGIVPALIADSSATGVGTDFATFDASNGIRPLAASEYAPLTSGSSALNNATLAGAQSVPAATTVNSLRLGPGSALTLGNQLTINSGAILAQDGAASTISGGSMQFSREAILHAAGASQLTISSQIAGGPGLTKSGSGTVTLTGTNTYTGQTTINAGVLEMSALSALGSSNTVNLNGGTYRANGSFTFAPGREFNVGDLAGGSISVAAGQTLQTDGIFLGAGTLTKSGPGTLFLNGGGGLFSGATRVSEGVLRIPSNDNIGSGTLYMNGGTLQATNTLTIDKQVVLEQGTTSTFVPATAGVLTISTVLIGNGNLAVDGAGTFTLTGNNLYFGTNAIRNGGTMYYTTSVGQGSTPAVAVGNYWSLDNGTLGFGLANLANAGTAAITLSANRGLTVNAGGGTIRVDQVAGPTVTFGTVTFSGSVVGAGVLNKLGNGTLIFTNGASTLAGGLNINEGWVRASGATIGGTNMPVGLNGGTLIVQTSALTTATRVVTVGSAGGTLDGGTFNNTVGPIGGGGNLTKLGTGNLTAASIRLNSLNASAGGNVTVSAGATSADPAKASVFGSLSSDGSFSLGATNSLNVTNNAVVVHYSSSNPRAALEAQLATGYAAGSWNGVGINSSTAAATAGSAVGIAEATDLGSPATFAGQNIDSSTVLIRYTRAGDANLSGTTDIDDFGVLAANFNQPSRWGRGDFNYSGTTDIDDFGILAANFNQGVAGGLARGSAVPEPASMGLIGVAAMLLGRRRRS